MSTRFRTIITDCRQLSARTIQKYKWYVTAAIRRMIPLKIRRKSRDESENSQVNSITIRGELVNSFLQISLQKAKKQPSKHIFPEKQQINKLKLLLKIFLHCFLIPATYSLAIHLYCKSKICASIPSSQFLSFVFFHPFYANTCFSNN